MPPADEHSAQSYEGAQRGALELFLTRIAGELERLSPGAKERLAAPRFADIPSAQQLGASAEIAKHIDDHDREFDRHLRRLAGLPRLP